MATKAIPQGYKPVTYQNHKFDPDTVRFLLIEYNPPSMITDLCNWDIKILTINEYDYDTPGTIQTAVWVVSETQGLVMFNLKYKNNIILEVNQKKMDRIMYRAHAGVSNRLKSMRVDYMFLLAKVAPVKRAIDDFLSSDKLSPWYKYYM